MNIHFTTQSTTSKTSLESNTFVLDCQNCQVSKPITFLDHLSYCHVQIHHPDITDKTLSPSYIELLRERYRVHTIPMHELGKICKRSVTRLYDLLCKRPDEGGLPSTTLLYFKSVLEGIEGTPALIDLHQTTFNGECPICSMHERDAYVRSILSHPRQEN